MKTKRITDEQELNTAFHIRIDVFVHEQGVPLDAEIDEFDSLHNGTEHILAYFEDKPVGTGRLRVVEGIGKLERICLLEPYRKYGLGQEIIRTLEEIALEKGLKKVKLHGQVQAEGFYKKLRYEVASEVFDEDGIPHVLMIKEL